MIADPSVKKFNGLSIGTTGSASQVATTFIQAAVTNLRGNVGTSVAEFNKLPQDEATPVLQLQPTDPATKKPVYNFAIARVRRRDTKNAPNVRVFFRIWQAQQTNASYNSTTYARAMNTESPSQPIPVLGVQGDEIITIPFFAQARVLTSQQLHTQKDDFNRHDIDFTSGGETDYFFGCWLDINQPNDLVYPQRIEGVSADGPFDTISPLFPIQQFMVAAHQCLIAEIAFDPDPIAPNSDPSNSDKLAQRNLAFVGVPNPGLPLSRRVPQTFEVKPTQPNLSPVIKPDELMIEWEDVPAGSFAEVYLPAVSAGQILAPEEAYFSIMKNTSAAIPATSRWYLIMQRYLNQLAGRITFMGGNPALIPPTSTGIWTLPGALPPHHEQHFIGKIETLIYDHFGDFGGFTLEGEYGEIHRFESREPRVEELTRRAWQDRSRVMVTIDSKHPRRPLAIVLLTPH